MNKFKVDCSNLLHLQYGEYADADGNITPETWPNAFMYNMKRNFFHRPDPELRPPESHIQGPTNLNAQTTEK